MKPSFISLFVVFALIWTLFSGKGLAQNQSFSPQQLLDMADYYTDKNNYDTALFYYSQLTNMSVKNADIELQKIAAKAFNRSAILYYDFSDYRTAYEFYIKALLLCEKSNYVAYMPRIYLNIGNIYFRFNKFDIAKSYYANALKLSQDSISIVAILNNLGSTELRNNNLDSAFYFLNKALYISKQHGDAFLPNVLDNLASYYQKVGQHDLALYYFRSALEETKKNGQIEMEAACLANLGRLFFEKNRIDSALFYIGLSNAIAEKNNFLRILADNYLTLSEIEKSKGNKTKALDFFEKYANLKDSVFNVDKFSDITQLQRLYEISKTNEQIERLAMEQEIKKRTIFYQKIVLIVLALICSVLLLLFFQKRKLDTAYETLVEKNLEIIDFQENFPEKYKKSGLTDGMQDELLDKILVIMEDTSIVCDTEFSVEKLAELVNSNQKYVSQVINSALKKNFRSFLNNYRIREAQRLFSNQETTKYTIESVAVMVGYKSRNSFCNVFKEVTGVTPNFYLKSIQALKTIQTHN